MYLVYPVSSVQVSGISYIPKALVQDVDPDFRKLVSSFMGYPKGRAIFTSGKTTLRKALATKELLAALAKHAAVGLHYALHGATDVRRGGAALSVAVAVKSVEGVLTRRLWQRLVWRPRRHHPCGVLRGRATEHHKVEE